MFRFVPVYISFMFSFTIVNTPIIVSTPIINSPPPLLLYILSLFSDTKTKEEY